jgi:hypothetical protein
VDRRLIDRPVPLPVRSRLATGGLGLAGLGVLVLGTFLPWLRSGQVSRNSYQTGGALQRLLSLPGPLQTAVSVWPFVGLACAATVALFAIGLHRSAAAASLLTAAAAAVISIAALTVSGSGLVAPVRLGPIVTLLGAILVVAAASLVLVSRRPAVAGEGAQS